jgi:2-C-methyl-D-erythritol 4-phosphate cytidylyltransferase
MEADSQTKVGAVIVAAGSSQRMGGVDKVWVLLGGQPIIARVVDTFQQCGLIDQIVVVLSQPNLEPCRKLITERGWSKVTDVCAGGERRQDSVSAGLSRLDNCRWAVIHDGARPLVTEDLIRQGLGEVKGSGAAAAAVPVNDTIKVTGDDQVVQQTLPRHKLWAVQTPQLFRFDIIYEAHKRVKDEVTDDAAMVEQLGCRVKLYMGSYDNIKLTTSDDLVVAEALWQKRGR